MSENGEIYTAGKNFTLPDFQAKNFTPLISPNFNIFGENEWKWRNLHRWQKIYTAAGSDGSDKFHLWLLLALVHSDF